MKRFSPIVFLSVFFIVPCIFFAGCAKDKITGKTTLNYYSLTEDIKLGTDVMKQQSEDLKKNKKKMDTAADGAAFQQLRQIVAKLAKVSHYPEFPYEVHLADVEVANAWCAPGGKIMVYTGLWDAKEGLVKKGNRDELAAVLAHEISHATARHVSERLSRISTMAIAGEVAASAIGVGSQEGGDTFRKIFNEGMNVYVPSYSRESESEADRLGLFYMAHAGFNPTAAVDLWARAAKKRGGKTSIFASHPASGERAENLRKLLPAAMEIYKRSKK